MLNVLRAQAEFLSTGGVLSSARVQTLDLFEYKSANRTAVIATQLIAVIVLVFFLWQEAVQIKEPWPKVRQVARALQQVRAFAEVFTRAD